MSLKEQADLALYSEEQIGALYRNVFATVSGRMVLEHLKLGAHYYKPSFEEENCNDKLCIFNEGKRAVVLSIDTMMALPPPSLPTGHQEAPP